MLEAGVPGLRKGISVCKALMDVANKTGECNTKTCCCTCTTASCFDTKDTSVSITFGASQAQLVLWLQMIPCDASE
jgi:hypothetical protein